MVLEVIHKGGGCQCIVGHEGNELVDVEVHVYYCENKDTHTALLVAGQKRICAKHAKEWEDRWFVTEVVADGGS